VPLVQLRELRHEGEPAARRDRPVEHERELQAHAVLREHLAVQGQLLRELAPALGRHDKQTGREARDQGGGVIKPEGQRPARKTPRAQRAVGGRERETERVERGEHLEERREPERHPGRARPCALRLRDRDQQQGQVGEAQDRAAHHGELIREAREEVDRGEQRGAGAEGAPEEREGKQLEPDVDEREAEQEAVARRRALEERRGEGREERRLVVAVVGEPGGRLRALRQALEEAQVAQEFGAALGAEARLAI